MRTADLWALWEIHIEFQARHAEIACRTPRLARQPLGRLTPSSREWRGPFTILESKASTDPLWDCRQHALGDSDGTVTINIAGNAGQSSSVLPMLKSHQNAFPPANYVGTQEASIHRLDSVAPEFLGMNGVAFLKVDVQGFEKQVLAGGKSTIDDHCVGMQLELSFLPLYEGGMLIPEALDLVYSLGFTLTGLLPCFIDANNGRMLQADGIFFREDD